MEEKRKLEEKGELVFVFGDQKKIITMKQY